MSTSLPQPLSLSSSLTNGLFRSETLQLWHRTAVLSVAWTGLFGLFAIVERFIAAVPEPFQALQSPAQLAVILLGFAHFLLAYLFLFTSSRIRDRRGMLWFLGLTLVGAGLCALASRFGGVRHPVIVVLILMYFVVHDVRDWVFFYNCSVDSPKDDHSTRAPLFRMIQWTVVAFLFSVAMPGYLIYRARRHTAPDDWLISLFFPFRGQPVLTFLAYLLPAMAMMAIVCLIIEKRRPGGSRALWRQHRPILMMLASYMAFVVIVTLIGFPEVGSFVILTHFVGWYLFSVKKIQNRPRPDGAVTTAWDWLRKSERGFHVLHLGPVLIILAALMVATYTAGKDTWVHDVFSKSSFYYWTIMHITISFLPR